MSAPSRASRFSLFTLGVLTATYPPLWFILLHSRFPMHHAEGAALDRFYLFVALSGVGFVAIAPLAVFSFLRHERLRWLAAAATLLALLPLNFWLPRLWHVGHL